MRDNDYSEGSLSLDDVRSVLRTRNRIGEHHQHEAQRLSAAAPCPGTCLGELGLSIRTENALDSAGIDTIEALTRVDRYTLEAIPGFGALCIREVVEALRKWQAGEKPSEPPLAKSPVRYQPGSLQKVETMIARADRGEQIFHPEDTLGQGKPMDSHERQDFTGRRGRAGSHFKAGGRR